MRVRVVRDSGGASILEPPPCPQRHPPARSWTTFRPCAIHASNGGSSIPFRRSCFWCCAPRCAAWTTSSRPSSGASSGSTSCAGSFPSRAASRPTTRSTTSSTRSIRRSSRAALRAGSRRSGTPIRTSWRSTARPHGARTTAGANPSTSSRPGRRASGSCSARRPSDAESRTRSRPSRSSSSAPGTQGRAGHHRRHRHPGRHRRDHRGPVAATTCSPSRATGPPPATTSKAFFADPPPGSDPSTAFKTVDNDHGRLEHRRHLVCHEVGLAPVRATLPPRAPLLAPRPP